MTNVADKYYDLVFTAGDPAQALMYMYCELFDKEESRHLKSKLLKHINIFGLRRVYIALMLMALQLSEVSDNVNSATRYLERILLSDLYRELFLDTNYTSTDLTDYIEEQNNLLEQKEKGIVHDG